VSGELRIGFFTRRPVAINEELTFDYQFQTVGKKQQKCLCGSANCRGTLGAPAANNPNSGLNSIWASNENASEASTSSDESESESEKEDTKNKKTTVKQEKEKCKSENVSSSSQAAASVTNSTSNSNQNASADADLTREIKSINALTNKDSVLKLCQLMFRTEDVSSQIDILQLLLDAKSDTSLKLFMDYHGLKLLWSWMIDLDTASDADASLLQLESKLKCLQLLSKLSIKNRSTIDEFKLLHLTRKWSTYLPPPVIITYDMDYDDEEMPRERTDTEISQSVNILMDKLLGCIEIEHDQTKKVNKLVGELNAKARELCEEWSNLKNSFKIPKRQQIEERREHERQLSNPAAVSSETTSSSSHETVQNTVSNEDNAAFNKRSSYPSSLNRSGPMNSGRFGGNQHYSQQQAYSGNKYPQNLQQSTHQPYQRYRNDLPGSDSTHSQYHYQMHQQQQQPQPPVATQLPPQLTKEQRRQLFEQKVREQEEAAARAAAAANAVTPTSEQQMGAQQTAMLQNNNQAQGNQRQELQWFYDHQTSQWIQCLVPIGPIQQSNTLLTNYAILAIIITLKYC
jgi:hypothetical protein